MVPSFLKHIVWVEPKRLTLHGEVVIDTAVTKIFGLDFTVVVALRSANPKASVTEVRDFKLAFTLSVTTIFKINQQQFLPYEMNEPQLRERPKWTLWFTLASGKYPRKFLLQFSSDSGKLGSDAEQPERHHRTAEP